MCYENKCYPQCLNYPKLSTSEKCFCHGSACDTSVMMCGQDKTCQAMPPVCANGTVAQDGKCACKLEKARSWKDMGLICEQEDMCTVTEITYKNVKYDNASCTTTCPTLPAVNGDVLSCACISPSVTGYNLCKKDVACFEGKCHPTCPVYPFYTNKTDTCICSISPCSNTHMCMDDICQPLPSNDCDIEEPASASCTCRGSDGGSVCEVGDICFVSASGEATCLAQCPEYPQIHHEPTTNSSCVCKGKLESKSCSVGQICRKTDATCLDPCITVVATNQANSLPCFCGITQTDCNATEVCNTDGCLLECSVNEVITDDKCYCEVGKVCEKDRVCHKDSANIDSCISECPPPLVTITEDVCFCTASQSTCARDQICNNHTSECSEPFKACPPHPELSVDGPCLCQDKVCLQYQSCNPDGTCEDTGYCALNQAHDNDFCFCKIDPGSKS